MKSPFDREIKPDWKEFVETILRKKTPKRVHGIELFLDAEVQAAIAKRYGLMQDWKPNDPVKGMELQFGFSGSSATITCTPGWTGSACRSSASPSRTPRC